MKRLIPLIILLLLSITIANAQTITIGVEPAIIQVNLNDLHTEEIVRLKLYNEKGDTDAEYTIELENDLKDFVVYDECGKNYWCENDNPILVPKGTTRDNWRDLNIKFQRKTSGNKEINSGIFIIGKPVGAENEGNLKIEPRVRIKTIVYQTGTDTTTSSPIEKVKEMIFGQPTSSTTTQPITQPIGTTTITSITTQPSRPYPITTVPMSTTKSESNLMWVLVPIIIVGIGAGIFIVWYFDLIPAGLFILLFLLTPTIVRANSIGIDVTVGDDYDYFNAITGLTQTVKNDTIVKETNKVYVAKVERVGNSFTYHIANNGSTVVLVKEIIMENPMKPKEYRIGSVTAKYFTDSGKEISVDVVAESPIIHIYPHSWIEIEPTSSSNTLELNFFSNVLGFTVGLLPFLTGVGIILFAVKQFFEMPINSHISVERIIAIMLTIIIAIILLTVLVATI